MIRRAAHTLKFATAAKRQKLDLFFVEYARVVNAFIELYWNTDRLPGKANAEVYGKIDSWMMGKARKCAANQAIKILKSVVKKDRQETYHRQHLRDLILPTKHHECSRHFEKTDWTQRKSLTLRRDATGRYYADLYWEKADSPTTQQGQAVGVDIGINKLMTCSDGTQLGTDIRVKLDKLNRRKQNSRNWHQTRKEIKDYIGYVTNRFPWNADVVVMENILNITQQTRGRVGKATRKLLGHWNIDLLYRRMADKAEQNRVFLAFVEPAYSSQTCSSCRAIDKKSRNGEVFKCTACGHADDADHNASMNILQRFLDGQFTVARGTQRA